MSAQTEKEECRLSYEYQYDPRPGQVVGEVVGELVETCGTNTCFEHISPIPLPSLDVMVEMIHLLRRIIFPGYFDEGSIAFAKLEYGLGQKVTELYQKLSDQITWCVRHDCYRYELECRHCKDQGRDKAIAFIQSLPELRRILADDVRAAFEGDPAGKSHDQIIFNYPGLWAVTIYRMAHILHEFEIPLLPRMMTEYAHSQTGIDIHPGARIGNHFFIDHGTGVVIGETTQIGDRVRLYQGVTLGALSLPPDAGAKLRGKKRHPTIEDDVIIYAGATILGGETVVGARSVIGGNVWLTESVPPDSKVLLKMPELVIRNADMKKKSSSHG